MLMKPYEKYKPSGVEWIGMVPEHWEVKRLKYVADNLNYKRIPLSSEQRSRIEKIYDYYGASGVIDQVDDFLFDGDFILVGEDGANLLTRSVPLAFKASGKFWVNNHAHILQPKNGNIQFFTYYLESIDYSIWISGSAQPKLTSENLMNIHLGFPPLPEQTAIARYLDQKTGEIDQLIAQKERLLALWEEEKTALINQAVTRGLDAGAKMKDSGVAWLGEVPEHWEVVSLKRCVSTKITDGPHETPEFLLEGVPFISAEAVQNGTINFESKRGYISEDEDKRFALKCKPRRDDIFIVKSGSTTGKVAIVKTDENFNIWSPLALVRANDFYEPNFLFHFLSSNIFQIQVQLFWSFGTQPNIGMNVLENLKVVRPKKSEQTAIVRHIETQTARIQTQMDQTRKLIELLKEYRATLISEVVTGKIKITQ